MLQKILVVSNNEAVATLANNNIIIVHNNLIAINYWQEISSIKELTMSFTSMITSMSPRAINQFISDLITEISRFYQDKNDWFKILSFEDQYSFFYEIFHANNDKNKISFFVNNICEQQNLDTIYYNFLAPKNKNKLDKSTPKKLSVTVLNECGNNNIANSNTLPIVKFGM